MSDSICAVVVTYNRIELLKECIHALRNQTRKLDEIIVVNNDSTDGTREWLSGQNDINAIHQENLGGAGGFHNGIKAAYEKGYDWVWCMDDDCLPNLNALEKLLTTSYKENVLLNSTVVEKSDPNTLTFGLYDFQKNILYRNYSEIKKYHLVFTANLFNGTLIHKAIITNIGFPKKEFFIYGDEYEYFLRIKSSNFIIATVVESIVKHPPQKHLYIGKGKFFYRINYLNLLGAKYFPRNISAICFMYDEFTIRKLFKTFFYDLFGLLFIQHNIRYFLTYIYSIIISPIFIYKLKKHS